MQPHVGEGLPQRSRCQNARGRRGEPDRERPGPDLLDDEARDVRDQQRLDDVGRVRRPEAHLVLRCPRPCNRRLRPVRRSAIDPRAPTPPVGEAATKAVTRFGTWRNGWAGRARFPRTLKSLGPRAPVRVNEGFPGARTRRECDAPRRRRGPAQVEDRQRRAASSAREPRDPRRGSRRRRRPRSPAASSASGRSANQGFQRRNSCWSAGSRRVAPGRAKIHIERPIAPGRGRSARHAAESGGGRGSTRRAIGGRFTSQRSA